VCLTLKVLLRLPYRAVEGLIKSLMRLNGLDLPVPDHTQMSRRVAKLTVGIPRAPRKGPVHVVIDSTGVKVFGDGEWRVRKHGASERRTWRKVHLAVDEKEKDIIGIEVTTTQWGDSELLPGLLVQVEGEIAQVSADGAYDTRACHHAIAQRGAKATIPPREGAALWGGGHCRDAILECIALCGRDGWKQKSGYHRRSMVENMMFRFKQLSDRLSLRTFQRQVREVHVRAAILNRFTYLGLRRSVRVGEGAFVA